MISRERVERASSGDDPILSEAGRRLARARKLYIKTACGPELDALAVAQDLYRKKTTKTRERGLDYAETCLRAAEDRANKIFDAVIAGEAEP